MSVLNLAAYIDHLRDNRQKTTRFEIALWQKALYPAAAIVMMLLATSLRDPVGADGRDGREDRPRHPPRARLPLRRAALLARGPANDWPAAFSAGMPAIIFLAVAAAGIARAERR